MAAAHFSVSDSVVNKQNRDVLILKFVTKSTDSIGAANIDR